VFLAWHHEPTYQPPRWWTYVGGLFILAGLLLRYGRSLRVPRMPAPGARTQLAADAVRNPPPNPAADGCSADAPDR
jgi:hypothetical protein